MKQTVSIVIALIVAFSGINIVAQEKGAEALMNMKSAPATNALMAKSTPVVAPTPEPPAPVETNFVSAIVKEKSKVSYSVHSRGFIQNPQTREVVAEIVTFRERGLWGNGCVTQLLLDPEGRPMAVLNSSASAGPGIALVQGASFVGGMYLFAEHMRPPKQNINSGNSNSGNSGTGSTTVNNTLSATSQGGAGGSASATGGLGGSATATGGTSSVGDVSATGGQANNTVSGGLGAQNVIVNSGDARGRGQIILGGGAPVTNP